MLPTYYFYISCLCYVYNLCYKYPVIKAVLNTDLHSMLNDQVLSDLYSLHNSVLQYILIHLKSLVMRNEAKPLQTDVLFNPIRFYSLILLCLYKHFFLIFIKCLAFDWTHFWCDGNTMLIL